MDAINDFILSLSLVYTNFILSFILHTNNYKLKTIELIRYITSMQGVALRGVQPLLTGCVIE
jgi:hypothetical protein